ncbi:MAG TPA: hypothetical protein VJ440_03550 [Candidatus Brocadiaceae bacterium]|nr:hypothetical protein [Candidatus Brocadiaceae bacterium]
MYLNYGMGLFTATQMYLPPPDGKLNLHRVVEVASGCRIRVVDNFIQCPLRDNLSAQGAGAGAYVDDVIRMR